MSDFIKPAATAASDLGNEVPINIREMIEERFEHREGYIKLTNKIFAEQALLEHKAIDEKIRKLAELKDQVLSGLRSLVTKASE